MAPLLGWKLPRRAVAGIVCCFIVLVISIPIDARDLRLLNEAEFDAQFRFPESYATDAERKVALKQFLDWISTHYPELTIEKFAELRIGILEKHECKETLKNIRERGTSK